MADRQAALAQGILKDPAVESLSSFIGVDGINNTLNSDESLSTSSRSMNAKSARAK